MRFFPSLKKSIKGLIVICLCLSSLGILSAQDNLPLYNLPNAQTYPAFSSNSLVALPNGRVATTNMLTDSIAIVDVRANELLAEIAVGNDPRSIDVTPDNTRLLVTNFGDGSLSILDLASLSLIANFPVGANPAGIITNNNETAFIALQADSAVIEIELASGEILTRIATPEHPRGLAIWGDFLYVTHFWSGEISLIYIPSQEVVRTISSGDNAGLSAFIYIDGRNGLAYVPQSLTYPINVNPTFDRIIRPRLLVIDLKQMQILPERILWLDIADRPVNMPFSFALNVQQGIVFVLNAGSNDLSVIDLKTGLARWNTSLSNNPRGIILSSDGTSLYVNNAMDTSLSVLETRFFSVEDTIPTSNHLPDLQTRIGAGLFHTSQDSRLSNSAYLSCASCHFDGSSDGRTWNSISTPDLSDLEIDSDTLNTHIETMSFGIGFDETQSFDQDALIAYMQSLGD